MRVSLGRIAIAVVLGTGSASAQVFEDVHECDTYAAHPDDPNRWARGVADEDIIPGPAVKYCEDAVEDHAETPRFQFQLGRAYWAARRFEEGTATFLSLEDGFEYEPVYAYLGDAFQFGIGGVDTDEELALQLYQVAADSGFGAAILAVEQITGIGDVAMAAAPQPELAAEPAPLAMEPVLAAPAQFDVNSFSQSRAIAALESGNLEGLKNAGLGSAQVMGVRYSKLVTYLQAFNMQFGGSFNIKDPTCIALYNPRVGKRLERDATMIATGGGTTQGAAGATLGMLMGTMQQMQTGNMMGMVDQSQAIEILREEGTKDGAKLILTYGCQHPVTQRIYANLVAHTLGGAPALSDSRRAAVAEAQKRAAERAERERQQKAEQRERARVQALRTNAQSSCEAQFKRSAFCTCLVDRFDTAGLQDDAWQQLGREFKSVVDLRDSYPVVPEILSSCRQASSN